MLTANVAEPKTSDASRIQQISHTSAANPDKAKQAVAMVRKTGDDFIREHPVCGTAQDFLRNMAVRGRAI
ncbi:MAG: hypothetical protein R3C10_11790 [Pirellulales bacterium]